MTAKGEGGPTDEKSVGPNETSESDATALAELVDLGHSVMQGQLMVFQEQNTKARVLLILSGGVLVVAVAMGGFIAEKPLGPFLGGPDLGVIGLLGFFSASFLAALTAFWLFIGALVGGTQRQPNELQIGWHPDNLLKAARKKDTLTDVRLATLFGYQDWIPKNKATLDSANRRLRSVVGFSSQQEHCFPLLVYIHWGLLSNDGHAKKTSNHPWQKGARSSASAVSIGAWPARSRRRISEDNEDE